MGKRRFPDQPIKDSRKCLEHNAWKRKIKNHEHLGAICELCKLRLDEIQKQNEQTGGSHHPAVIIKKL